MIPAAAKHHLAKFCDAFCEKGAFNADQCRRVLEAGLEHGLLPKLHADQLSYGGGAELAAELGAVSVDHLDHVSDAGIAALAAAERRPSRRARWRCCCPGRPSSWARAATRPPARLLDAGARVALSTDLNPGLQPHPEPVAHGHHGLLAAAA